MSRVFFINGQSERVAEIFSEEAPREGFELTWLPRRVSDEEKLPLMREADFLVLHPAQISEDLLRAAKTLRLIQLLTAGYDKTWALPPSWVSRWLPTAGLTLGRWPSTLLPSSWLFTSVSSSVTGRCGRDGGGSRFRGSTLLRWRAKPWAWLGRGTSAGK